MNNKIKKQVEKALNWWISTKIYRIITRFSNDNLPVYSAQSAFFLFISIFPIIILLSTLIRYTPLTEDMIIGLIEGIAPNIIGDTLISWVNEIYNGNSGYISFSFIFILWSASKSFIGIIDGLDNIYKPGIHFSRLLNRLRAILCTIIFLAAVGIASILLLFGSMLSEKIHEYLPALSKSIVLLINFRMLICFAILFIILTFMYSFLTRQTVRIKSALPGAVSTTIGWFVFSYLHSIYINYSIGKISIYGSITTIILLLLWLYICVFIFLIGAELNYYIITHKNESKQSTSHTV